MSIEAINEQLLRAVGVGVALFDAQHRRLKFRNDIFFTWFESADIDAALDQIFTELDEKALGAALDADGSYTTEMQFRKKRRTLVIAQTFTRAQVGNEDVLVLECQNISRIRELEAMIDSYSSMVERNTREISREKEQVEKLLLNIMPRAAYEEFKSFGVVAPQKYESVSVLVLDFVDFAEAIDRLAPATFVSELNELYSAFDRIGEQFGCERIKTTGDTYLCVAGMQDPEMDHAAAVANSAIRFVRYLSRRNENAEAQWYCRIGLGGGSVVGSVVGVQKYVYDVFGLAVNAAIETRAFAESMEALAAPEVAEMLNGAVDLIPPKSKAAQDDGIAALGTV